MPYPSNDGGAIAMLNMAKGLKSAGCELSILSYNTKKHYFNKRDLPESFHELGALYTVDIDASVKPIDAFLNLFSTKSYNISRFDQETVREKIKLILSKTEYDVIHFEGLFTSMYVDLIRELAPKSKLVLRQHNIEYKIWERMASQSSFPKKSYLKLLAKRLKKYELNVFQKFDALVPITSVDEKDVKAFDPNIKTFVSPTGVSIEDYQKPTSAPEENSVFHFGSLNWLPNQEGLKWFVEECWPIIHAANPELKFYIAGRDMPEWMGSWNGKNNIIVVGEVEDAVEFYNSKNVMIVPLLSGSGMRIKIIEGMAAGKSIVSTSIGAEGIDVANNKNIILSDQPKSFANSVLELFENKELANLIGANARELVAQKYSNESRVKDLVEFYKSLMN